MPLGFDFGIVPQAIELRAKRAELIANNLANADTPGFKAKDLNFRQIMADVAKQHGAKLPGDSRIESTHPGHQIAIDFGSDHDFGFGMTQLQYRNAHQASVDGNTVDTQVEKAEFAENQLRYQVSVNYLDGMVKSYKKALTGN